MKPGILNIDKWAAKTADAVSHLIQKEGKPCIAFGLCFFEPINKNEAEFSFKIELAGDPHHPLPEDDKKRIRASMEVAMEWIKKIMTEQVDIKEVLSDGGSREEETRH